MDHAALVKELREICEDVAPALVQIGAKLPARDPDFARAAHAYERLLKLSASLQREAP